MGAPVKHTCPDIDSLQDDVKKMASDLCYQLESLRKANAALRDWGEEMESDLSEANDRIEDLQKENEQLQKEIDELKSIPIQT